MLTKILTKMKKVIKICSTVVVVAAITCISYWSNSSRNSDVNLSELVEISDADAECSQVGLLTGKCIPMMQVCTHGGWGYPDEYPCDPCYSMNRGPWD